MRDDFERGYAIGRSLAPVGWGAIVLGFSWVVYRLFGRARFAANVLAAVLLSFLVFGFSVTVVSEAIFGPRLPQSTPSGR